MTEQTGRGGETRYLLMSEVALSLSQAANLESLKAEVLPKLKYVIDFSRCGLALINDDGTSYRLFTILETRQTVRSIAVPHSSCRCPKM